MDVWLRSQESLGRDGDVVDMLGLISDIFHDGYVKEDELVDLNQLIIDIIEYQQSIR